MSTRLLISCVLFVVAAITLAVVVVAVAVAVATLSECSD